ncbi:hypothetical protein ACTD5D_22605 [Nocardia takedensis]|uniref:hypothetical protein n=1 Tax=Nocardia takedensis TaxID=259390 RepID=UPI003F76B83C
MTEPDRPAAADHQCGRHSGGQQALKISATRVGLDPLDVSRSNRCHTVDKRPSRASPMIRRNTPPLTGRSNTSIPVWVRGDRGQRVIENPGRLTVNSRMVQNIRMLGMSHQMELIVTEYRPPLRLVMTGRGSGGISCEFEFSIERHSGGSTLSMQGEFNGPLINAELAQVVAQDADTQMRESMRRLAVPAGETSPAE